MAKPKTIEKPVRLSVVLSEEQAKQVEKAAIQQSAREGRRITSSEMIRRAIEICYPTDQQMRFL